jgi:hypothetical protein
VSEYGGVVYEHVERGKAFSHRLTAGGDGFVVPQIDFDVAGFSAVSLDLGNRTICQWNVIVHDDDVGAFSRQTVCGCASNAGGAAGYQGNFVRESVRAPGICLHAFFLLNEMALAEFRL